MKDSKLARIVEKQKDRITALMGKSKEFAKSGHVPGPVGLGVTLAGAGLTGAIDGLTQDGDGMTAAWVGASVGLVAGAACHMAGAPTAGNVALDAAAGPASALSYHHARKGLAKVRLAAMASKGN